MRVVAGLELGGATLGACDDLARRSAWIGDVVWSPQQLLGDLELRLGLSAEAEPRALRVASWQARLAALASEGRFYSSSFALDALGTADALLALRDSLVAAGWDGQEVPGAGVRIAALAELERHPAPALPPGYGDRLRCVEQALSVSAHRGYDELLLVEPARHWPLRWQRIFDALERTGTRIAAETSELPGASGDSDLRRIQIALEPGSDKTPSLIEGDGSFVLLTADTSWEAARATAAILGELEAEHTVVIRQGDGSALDHALATQGLPTQGHRATSLWRAALQILPLALELTFEPKDPYRVLELLSAPGGPFQGRAGRRLSRALARSPGIGSPDWEQAKVSLATVGGAGASGVTPDAAASELGQRIAEWLEGPTADPIAGASKEMLRGVVDRAHAWLLSRIAASPQDGALLAAASAATAFRAALEREPRATLDLLAVRKLSTMTLGAGGADRLLREQSGRVDHVDRASALAVPRKNVIWWFFAGANRQPARVPWRSHELRALNAIGVRFPDSRARLLERARQRRRALRCATERVILVAPRACARDRLALDPLWDEIRAAARLDEAACHRVTLEARRLLESSGEPLLRPPPRIRRPRAPLPGGHLEWNIGSPVRGGARRFSATSLGALLACPLRWVLSYAAQLKSARQALPPLHRLAGTLGHRLVEVLHQRGNFDEPEALLEANARSTLDGLIPREGALLLRPGMSFEREQVTTQLVRAVVELARSLRSARLRIVAVEHPVQMPWRAGELGGRIDVLVEAADGSQHILDLKWGVSSYRKALEQGRALQLAVYTALHAGRERQTEAAFFSLRQGELIGLRSSSLPIHQRVTGRSLSETWSAAERTANAAEAIVAQGHVAVSGLGRSLPLVEALGIEPSERHAHFAVHRESICEYCELDVLCGRRWEAGHARG